MSIGSVQPFILSGSTTFAATTTANSRATGVLNGSGDVLVVTNLGTSAVYISTSGVAVAGGVNSVVIPAGGRRVLGINAYVGNVSVVTASGTATVVVECGTGTVFG